MDNKVQQTKLANNLGKLLRENFGKGPQSINVIISIPYVLVYVRGFISPMEQVLLDQNQELTVKTTREFLMKTIDPEIRGQIQGITVGVCKNTSPDLLSQYDYKAKDLIHEEIIQISEQAEKAPRFVSSYLISPAGLNCFQGRKPGTDRAAVDFTWI
ncbi:Na-translocating system protein MpsC family protein [Actinomycetes bacterium NPDC127524]